MKQLSKLRSIEKFTTKRNELENVIINLKTDSYNLLIEILNQLTEFEKEILKDIKSEKLELSDNSHVISINNSSLYLNYYVDDYDDDGFHCPISNLGIVDNLIITDFLLNKIIK